MAMRIFSVSQNKGGDGKTTTSVILSTYLAHVLNEVTVLVDFDPQCNASLRFLAMEDDDYTGGKSIDLGGGRIPPLHPNGKRYSSADLFADRVGELQPYPTKFKNLYVLPGDAAAINEAEARGNSSPSQMQGFRNRLQLFFRRLAAAGVKYVVVDNPPSIRAMSIASLTAATDIVIPFEAGDNSFEGVRNIMRQIVRQQPFRSPSIPLLTTSIYINKADRGHNIFKETLNDLHSIPQLKSSAMQSYLPRLNAFKALGNWNKLGQDLPETMPFNEKAGQERDLALRFCEELMSRVNAAPGHVQPLEH